MDPISDGLMRQMKDGGILTPDGERFIFDKNWDLARYGMEPLTDEEVKIFKELEVSQARYRHRLAGVLARGGEA